MNSFCPSSQKESDLRNPISYELTDFFDLVLRSLTKRGCLKREARARAYDAVELRYHITKSRARNIMYAVRNGGDSSRRMRPSFFLDNKDLIEILQAVNEEYTDRKRV